jgi:alkanesulfonate monooxygenase SsuD/methylene tetrahydromethanopterin reductase-like flavin-dependent oxidoreductase (luciferase family)
MRFGLFLEWPNAGARPWHLAFDEAVVQAQLAESVGFDFCLIAEHHFSDYGIAPAPILEALAILRATTTLRVGTGVAVLPEWQPLRLAEEMAVADQLSGGRFIAGVGRGFVPFEQERFGGGMEGSRAHFNECLDVLLSAWTETDFTYRGVHTSVPVPTTVLPRPFQRPHPPVWLAGNSADSVELVGRHGFTPIVSGALGPARIAALASEFAQARARHARADEPLEIVAQTHCHVVSDPEELRGILPEARWQSRAVPALLANRVARGELSPIALADELSDEELLRAQLFGTPDAVIERIAALQQAGVTHVSTLMSFGGLDHARIVRSIELFGRAVLPAFL